MQNIYKKSFLLLFFLVFSFSLSACTKEAVNEPVEKPLENNATTTVENGATDNNDENKITENPFVIEPVDTSNWQAYHNEHFGFDMLYPDNWSINEDIWRNESNILNKKNSKTWAITFNSHILVNGEPHLVHLFFTKSYKRMNKFDRYPDYINQNTKIYAAKDEPSYLRNWFVENGTISLSIEKIVEINEGLGWKPEVTREEGDFIFSIFDNMIKTIKFTE